MRRTRELFLYLVVLTLWFYLLYGTSNWLAQRMPYRISMDEMTLPFVPQWAPVYLSLNLLLGLSFLLTKRRAELFTALLIQTTLAWPVFVFLPLEPITLPSQPESVWFLLADAVNLHLNYLPSLHVAYATTCALIVRRFWVLPWVLAISASTLLTHQHYPVDVVMGAALALLAVWWTKGPGRPFALCVGELVRCSARHSRYALIAVALFAYLLVRPRAGWKALVGFCYLQRMDDLLDGHLECEIEPEERALAQIDRWKAGTFGTDTLETLGQALYKSRPSTDKIVAIIQEMVLDRVRVRERTLLDDTALKAHLEQTFTLSLDLMLWPAGAELKARDVPSLAPLLGWCSVVRDLSEDLDLGLVNLPVEATDSAEEWFVDEHRRARALFDEASVVLGKLQGRSGIGLLRIFHRSVEKYLRSHDAAASAALVLGKMRELDFPRPKALK